MIGSTSPSHFYNVSRWGLLVKVFFFFCSRKVGAGITYQVRAVLPVKGLEPLKRPAGQMLTCAGVEPASLSHL